MVNLITVIVELTVLYFCTLYVDIQHIAYKSSNRWCIEHFFDKGGKSNEVIKVGNEEDSLPNTQGVLKCSWE